MCHALCHSQIMGVEATQILKILFSIQVKRLTFFYGLILCISGLLCLPSVSNILISSKYFNSIENLVDGIIDGMYSSKCFCN